MAAAADSGRRYDAQSASFDPVWRARVVSNHRAAIKHTPLLIVVAFHSINLAVVAEC